MELILVDISDDLPIAWKHAFTGLPNVTITSGRFEEVDGYDCLVSPANSFGIMDGGIDLAISHFFGWSLMERVQARICREYYGEQPVGTSMIVETGNVAHPYLAHTPTMRVPRDIRGTDNCYVAMSAMLRAVAEHNRESDGQIRSVLCPGLGTATGQLPAPTAAHQMALAYRAHLNPPQSISWQFARDRENEVYAA